MRNGLVIADAGPIFSLALVDKLSVLDQLFDDIRISKAVWRKYQVMTQNHTMKG